MTNNEAVSILTEWVDNGTHEFIHEALQLAIKALETQPDGDTISRQAAIAHWQAIIDATNEDSRYNMGFVDGLEFCISDLSTMPSVKPEVAKDTNVLNNDTISRQAAISAITSHSGVVDKSVAKRILAQLPSTQPDPCDGCEWECALGYGECHHCQRNYNDMYEAKNE